MTTRIRRKLCASWKMEFDIAWKRGTRVKTLRRKGNEEDFCFATLTTIVLLISTSAPPSVSDVSRPFSRIDSLWNWYGTPRNSFKRRKCLLRRDSLDASSRSIHGVLWEERRWRAYYTRIFPWDITNLTTPFFVDFSFFFSFSRTENNNR